MNLGLKELLANLGFTDAEAELYMFLIAESPATGYRAAQAIGRPASQTYKAIESLTRKGAVMVDDGNTRLCRAVPPEEYLSHLQRSFGDRIQVAKTLLRKLPKLGSDYRVYQIESFEEVMERARRMLERGREVLIADLFPGPLATLTKSIENAYEKGRRIAVKIYKPSEIRCTLKVLLTNGPDVIESWPGEILNIVIDGREFLSALLKTESHEVRNAIWSSNPFLAARQHNGLSCEIGLTLIQTLVSNHESQKRINSALKEIEPFYFRNTSGFKNASTANF